MRYACDLLLTVSHIRPSHTVSHLTCGFHSASAIFGMSTFGSTSRLKDGQGNFGHPYDLQAIWPPAAEQTILSLCLTRVASAFGGFGTYYARPLLRVRPRYWPNVSVAGTEHRRFNEQLHAACGDVSCPLLAITLVPQPDLNLMNNLSHSTPSLTRRCAARCWWTQPSVPSTSGATGTSSGECETRLAPGAGTYQRKDSLFTRLRAASARSTYSVFLQSWLRCGPRVEFQLPNLHGIARDVLFGVRLVSDAKAEGFEHVIADRMPMRDGDPDQTFVNKIRPDNDILSLVLAQPQFFVNVNTRCRMLFRLPEKRKYFKKYTITNLRSSYHLHHPSRYKNSINART